MCGIAGIAGGAPPDTGVLERMASMHGASRPRRGGTWRDELRRPRIPAPRDHRSRRAVDAADAPRALASRLQRRDLQLPRAARRARAVSATSSSPKATARCCCTPGPSGRTDALDRLDGMFAFAIWHDERRELICACDPFGEKPLYLGARTASGSCSHPTSARCCRRGRTSAHRGRTRSARTSARGLCRRSRRASSPEITPAPGRAPAPPAPSGRVEVRRYWRPSRVDVPARYEDAVERLRELLLDSIRRRLRADVPVGTSLSGGVDSSAVVALSATLAGDHRRHAFTARFPGFARDEWRYADEVARAAQRRRASCRRADRGRAPRRPRRARRLAGGAVRFVEHLRAVVCHACGARGRCDGSPGRPGRGRDLRRVPRARTVGAPVRWAARGPARARLLARSGATSSSRSARSERPQPIARSIVGRR